MSTPWDIIDDVREMASREVSDIFDNPRMLNYLEEMYNKADGDVVKNDDGTEFNADPWIGGFDWADPDLKDYLTYHALGPESVWVSYDMCQIIMSAANTYGIGGFFPKTPFSDNGFAFFEMPITFRYDDANQGLILEDENEHTMTALSWYVPDDTQVLEIVFWSGNYSKRSMFPMRCTYIDLKKDTPLFYGNIPMDRLFDAMQVIALQEIASQERRQFSRPERRRRQRQGLPPDMTVFTLRRQVKTITHQEAQRRGYSHRFIVRGHWRDQACGPQRRDRKTIWIHDFVKGDPDKPLVIKERVWKLSR